MLILILWLLNKLINWIYKSVFDTFDNDKSVFKYINLFSKQKRRGTNLVLLSILLTTSKFEGLEKEYSITIGPCGIDESNGSGNNLFCLRNEFLQIKVFKFNPKVNCFIWIEFSKSRDLSWKKPIKTLYLRA